MLTIADRIARNTVISRVVLQESKGFVLHWYSLNGSNRGMSP
jgi:hypothetical protein